MGGACAAPPDPPEGPHASPALAADPDKALRGTLAGRFLLPANEVQTLQQRHGLTAAQLLTALIPEAAALARPPISKFHVGAVGLGKSGTVYIGVNLEFPGLPLNNSVHAEQSLLANAAWHGESALERLAVSAAPCGHCRQFYSELACAEAIRISFGDPPVEYGLPGLLPQRFGPADLLGDSGAPLLLQPQHNRVAFAAGSAAAALEHSATAAVAAAKQPSEACPPLPAVSTENGVALTNGRGAAPEAAQRPAQPRQNGGAGVWGPLEAAAKRALQAANEAYCPYSRCPAGVAVVAAGGEVHWGAYLESAAFNPSLGPLQSALTAAVRAGLPSYCQITHAILVEIEGAHVQHAETVALVLSKVAPAAKLVVLRATANSPSRASNGTRGRDADL